MWDVIFDADFAAEFEAYEPAVQDEILYLVGLLQTYGPTLPRPYADTLKGSTVRNLKELRGAANRIEWRVAYAFDPKRRAVLLCAGAKGGSSEDLFYKQLIATAEARFARYL